MVQANTRGSARQSRNPTRICSELLERRALLASIAVTTLGDSGAGSLRQAIADAVSGDTIDLTGVAGTITLDTELLIEKDLTLDGPGQDVLAISGNDMTRVFNQSGAIVSVDDLTIRNGDAGNGIGGGWRSESGSTSFTRVRFVGNQAGEGGAIAAIAFDEDVISITLTESSVVNNLATTTNYVASGGGICLYALDGTEVSQPGVLNFTMTRSLVASNTASGPTAAVGGGIYARANGGLNGLGGGVLNATIENSTIADNLARATGTSSPIAKAGGLFVDARGGESHYANDSDVSLTLKNNTIARNSVTVGAMTGSQRSGAGIYLSTTGITDNPFDITIGNNLIIGNVGAEDAIALLGSSFNVTNLGHNLFGSKTGLTSVVNGQNGDLVGADAKLGTLGDHGGPTQTLSILYGSPAIDAGDDATAPSTDQRGIGRVGTSDIGAYEWRNTAPTWPTQTLSTSRVGAAYEGLVSASDIDSGQVLTFSLIDAPLFLSFVDNGDGTGTITGTPALADFGSHQITLRVSDGTDTADVVLTLVVRNSLHVLNTDDSGPGSLRQSVADAGVGDTVDLTNITGTITLLSPLVITKDIHVLGSGRDALSISGSDATSLFVLGDEATNPDITITDLTLANGFGDHGGAIYLVHGTSLNLSRVRITSSHATLDGGAIASADASNSMKLVDCLIDHNSAGRNGGGILAAGDASFTRTTISYNTIDAIADESGIAAGGGAGLALVDGTHNFLNSTIANNSITTADADTRIAEGAGVLVRSSTLTMIGVTIALNVVDVEGSGSGFGVASGFEPTLTIRNSLIAGNTGSVDASWPTFNSSSAVSHTLIGRMQTNTLAQHGANGCQVGTVSNPINAKLGSLDDNGGLVPTIRLRKGSPAINAGSNDYASTADQRGVTRQGQPDLGAFEYVPPANLSPTWITSALESATTSVPYSLALSATDANPDETLTLSLISGPAFLQLTDNGDGTATLYGTPTLAHVGTHSILLRVSDGTAYTSLYTNITVAASLAELDDGTLYINGTNGNDVIDAILVAPSTVRVTRGSTVRTFALGSVTRIIVNGFGGNDSLKAQINRLPATVYGGAGNDTIRGGGGDDQLFGDTGDDYIDTGAGRNKAYGGDGNDTMTGGNSADRLSGENGDDLISGRGGPDILYGNDGADYIDAGSDRNRANGGSGNDTIIGGNSIDRLNGDEGDDYLIGNRGKDYLTGGAGNDRAQIDASDILDSIEIIA